MNRKSILDKMINKYIQEFEEDNSEKVIIISPKTMEALRQEAVEMKADITRKRPYSVNIMGRQVPVIINDTLPDNVNGLVMSKKEYDDLEKAQLMAEWLYSKGGLDE